jgi:hypothetical protein
MMVSIGYMLGIICGDKCTYGVLRGFWWWSWGFGGWLDLVVAFAVGGDFWGQRKACGLDSIGLPCVLDLFFLRRLGLSCLLASMLLDGIECGGINIFGGFFDTVDGHVGQETNTF